MGSQPNLASMSKVVSIYKSAQKNWGPTPNWDAKTSNFGPPLPRLPHLTSHISGTKRSMDKQKCQFPSTMCPLQGDLLSVTFDPETAEIRLLIVTQHSAAITLQPLKLRHLQFVSVACASLSWPFRQLLSARDVYDGSVRLSRSLSTSPCMVSHVMCLAPW